MANVLTVTEVRAEMREHRVRYNVVLSGNYAVVARGQDVGEVLKLETALNPSFLANANWGENGPNQVSIINGPAGYAAQILPGATGLHWLLKIYAIGAVGEFAAGAYSASLLADLDFTIEAVGRSFD